MNELSHNEHIVTIVLKDTVYFLAQFQRLFCNYSIFTTECRVSSWAGKICPGMCVDSNMHQSSRCL